jgi:hypothetical protein
MRRRLCGISLETNLDCEIEAGAIRARVCPPLMIFLSTKGSTLRLCGLQTSSSILNGALWLRQEAL